MDQIAYGIGAALPKPPTNRSLTLQGSQWVQAAPTPGYAESPTGGTLDATVQDVPPEVSLGDVPTRVRTGTVFPVTFTVAEPNGDPVTWRIEDNTGVLAQGTGTGSKSADLVAPDTPRAWPIALVASDGTQETRIAFSVQVALSDLDVQVPAGGVAFPPLVPGSADVDALSDITIRNLGSSPLTLLVDVSDFTGSGNATIPVAGALRVGTVASDGTITWTEYMGPLTELPALPAGAEVGLRFRVATVPVPLPAGDYTTSFTVTAP